jgi:hypothetical protein
VKIESRDRESGPTLILIPETPEESRLIDSVLGSTVTTGDGLIARVRGEVRLSDGYGEHYISLRVEEGEG